MTDSIYSILIADDSRDYRNLVTHYLADLPCELKAANDGEDAVEAFSEEDFDLIIMDIIMPLMDGVDAIAAIRRIEAETGRGPTPILALSMEDSLETSVDSINAGATRMILKPVSRQGLISAVCEALEIANQYT